MDDELDALPWAAHLPEQDRARLREELESWRATAEAYRDGHGETLSTPVDLTDYELPAEAMTRVEESRAAGPGRTGRPVRRAHMDAARDAEGDGTELGDAELADYYNETHDLSEFDGPSEKLEIARRDVTVSVRFTAEEFAALRLRAGNAGTKVTAFLRAAALRGHEEDRIGDA